MQRTWARRSRSRAVRQSSRAEASTAAATSAFCAESGVGRRLHRRRVQGRGTAWRMAPRGGIPYDQADGRSVRRRCAGDVPPSSLGIGNDRMESINNKIKGQHPHRVRVQEYGRPHRAAYAADTRTSSQPCPGRTAGRRSGRQPRGRGWTGNVTGREGGRRPTRRRLPSRPLDRDNYRWLHYYLIIC